MPPLTIIIALVIILVGAIIRPTKTKEPSSILGEINQESSIQKDAILPSTPRLTPTGKKKPLDGTPTSIPSPIQKDAILPSTPSLNEFLYPNASVKELTRTSLNLESNDNPDSVTDWYKEKIKSMGMNAKSFIVTKTNGNVLNKLVGANGKTEIRVEITKPASENIVRIVVSLNN